MTDHEPIHEGWFKKTVREHMLHICIKRALFALRFSHHDCDRSADWLILALRIIRFVGSDKELEMDRTLVKIFHFERW